MLKPLQFTAIFLLQSLSDQLVLLAEPELRITGGWVAFWRDADLKVLHSKRWGGSIQNMNKNDGLGETQESSRHIGLS